MLIKKISLEKVLLFALEREKNRSNDATVGAGAAMFVRKKLLVDRKL